MYFKCCVSNCASTRNDATLHKFPSNETQRNKWLQCLKDEPLQEASLKNLFVCQRHFERRFVTAKSRLLNAAYPTLFTALEISSGKPEVDTEHVDYKVDHNYSRKRHLDHTYCKDLSLSHEMPGPSKQPVGLRKLRTEEPSSSKTAVPEPNEQIVISERQSNEKPPSSNNVPVEVLADTSASSSILRIEVREKTPPTGSSNIIATTPKSRKTSRQKIIHKLKNLTPTCQRIYKEYTKVKNQADFHKRAKRAVKFSKEQSFENLVKGMNPYSKKFIAMQINLCTKKKKGRRFSLDEKLFALSIMKQSPKCYRFLHKIFILPSTSTLNKMVSKLNIEAGINDQFFKLMKKEVKNCVRVLSKTMAAALSYTAQFSHYVDGTPVSKTLQNTAETVSFFDDLFDSVNGAASSIHKAQGKALRTAVRENSRHHEFWPAAIKKLEKMKFVDKNGVERSVPTLKNFIITLKSYIKLWQEFKNLNFKIMRPRYFNTDPIENFFGQVRAYNYRNNDPTCHNFINTFKSLTITRVIRFHSDSYNCEDDSAKQLINLKALFNTEEENSEKEVLPNHPREVDCVQAVEQARKERLNTHSRPELTPPDG